MSASNSSASDRLVGLVPAAGAAVRLGTLPCSKEIYPVGPPAASETRAKPTSRVACHDLLEAFVRAGVTATYVVLGHGKWDIPAFLGNGEDLGLDLAYLTIKDSPSTVHTIDCAHTFVSRRRVAFGFPDILFRPRDAVARLVERQDATAAEVVLGLFPASSPAKVDMVEVDPDSTVRRIVIKPRRTSLELTWILAVWSGRFTAYLHEFLASCGARRDSSSTSRELYVGDVIQAAIREGWSVEGVEFGDGVYEDIGTPDDLTTAVRASVS